MQPEVRRFVVGPIQTNAYLVTCEGDALLIDPGAPDPALAAAVAGVTLRAVVFTHGHYDHIAGAEAFRAPGVPFLIGTADAACLTDPARNLSHLVTGPLALAAGPDRTLADGETLEAGPLRFTVLAVPGHSPGSIALYGYGMVFCGDVLFDGSIGRTDLPGGDQETLVASIREKLYALPDATIVRPGHGPGTSIGKEKRSNFFVRGS